MLIRGATHRSAPLTGRVREQGLLTQLLTDALESNLELVRVAGPTGVGRRRLIEETARHLPRAEWIDLAPGGVEINLQAWAEDELPDLLESYPHAPVPSWALHVLGRLSPPLADRAPIPTTAPEPLPGDYEPEILGAAVGAVAKALIAHVPVVVYAGLLPQENQSARARSLDSLRGVCHEVGMVMVAAGPARNDEFRAGERTLVLGAIDVTAVAEIAKAWGVRDTKWVERVHRVTRGHPFYIHELVRWLEEAGCLRVDDDAETVELLRPVGEMPIPLSLDAVLHGRFERLDMGARYVLDLVTHHDGELTLEQLRLLYEGRDDGFDQALATLRQRAFLLHRTPRRPIALSSPLWRGTVEAPSRRKFKRRRTRTHPLEPVLAPHRSASPLARTLAEIPETARQIREMPHEPPLADLARLWRSTRHRGGPGWDGVRGRIAVLAARLREQQEQGGTAHRRVAAMRWSLWCLDHLPADRHPVLRRAAADVLLRCLERGGLAARAAEIRAGLHEEALLSGHLVTAALLHAAVAEGDRRLGRLDSALRKSAMARSELETMGLPGQANLASVTRVLCLVDLRRWEEAAATAETLPLETGDWSWLTEAEEPHQPAHLLRERYSRPLVHGWGWGLDVAGPYEEARSRLALAWPRDIPDEPDPILAGHLRRSERNILAADLWEMAAQRPDGNTDPASRERATALAVSQDRKLGFETRLRDLARVLRGTSASSGRAFDPLRRYLLNTTAIRNPGPPEIVLRVLGTGSVRRGGAVWPRGLWPEWWLRVLGRALALEILGRAMDGADLLAAVGEAGRDPGGDADPWVEQFNRLLWGQSQPRGGLDDTGARLRWNRGGLRCDALEMLDGDPTPDLLPNPAAIAGVFLPGLLGAPETEARAVLGVRMADWIRTWMREDPGMEASRYTALLEGPSRAMDLESILAPRLRIRGWSRTAEALRRGPSSAGA